MGALIDHLGDRLNGAMVILKIVVCRVFSHL